MNIFKEIRKLKERDAEHKKEIKVLKDNIKRMEKSREFDVKHLHKLRKQDSCKHKEREFHRNNAQYGAVFIYLEKCHFCGKCLNITRNKAEWEARKFAYEENYHSEALMKLRAELKGTENE